MVELFGLPMLGKPFCDVDVKVIIERLHVCGMNMELSEVNHIPRVVF